MKHFTDKEWLIYVKNDIPEKDREEYENHLYTCNQCLEHYLQAIEASESSLPLLTNEDSFTDLVMIGVLKQGTKQASKKAKTNTKTPIDQRAIFHYILAAAATLFLMFSGVFQSLASYAGAVDTTRIHEKRPSVTEGVMNKTFEWMDSLEKKEANEK